LPVTGGPARVPFATEQRDIVSRAARNFKQHFCPSAWGVLLLAYPRVLRPWPRLARGAYSNPFPCCGSPTRAARSKV
jgi:hypothetical protein